MTVRLTTLAVLTLVAALAVAQTRTETSDASGAQATELHCSKSSDGTWECYVCVSVTTSVDTGARTFGRTDSACGRPRALRATVNQNRAQNLADALTPAALRQAGFEAVDAGSP